MDAGAEYHMFCSPRASPCRLVRAIFAADFVLHFLEVFGRGLLDFGSGGFGSGGLDFGSVEIDFSTALWAIGAKYLVCFHVAVLWLLAV